LIGIRAAREASVAIVMGATWWNPRFATSNLLLNRYLQPLEYVVHGVHDCYLRI
jgi:hypothetical protein